MEKNYSAHKPLFGILLACVVASVFAAVVFGGMVGYLFLKKDSVASLSAKLSMLADEELYYRGLERALADTDTERKLLDSYFADPVNFVPLAERVETLGAHAGVSVTIKSAALTDSGRTLTLALSLGGDFNGIFYFLSLLEAIPAKLSFERGWVRKSADDARRKSSAFPWEGNFIVTFASM